MTLDGMSDKEWSRVALLTSEWFLHGLAAARRAQDGDLRDSDGWFCPRTVSCLRVAGHDGECYPEDV